MFNNNTGITIPEHLRSSQEAPFTKEEIAKAVLQMKNNKCPGLDGLPIDLYKVFWMLLGDAFYAMLQYAFECNKLSSSMRRGLINLIPKANKDVRFLKNLRPITLLNADYKIIEKVIANRIVPSLDFIISQDQQGFMANRRISINIRKMLDLIIYAENHDIPAYVLSLDFEKCFDKIDFSAIFGAMQFFEYPDYLIKWTKILYTDFTAQMQNNGYFSNIISVKRSVHQGGPCSSYYFLICAELLAIVLDKIPKFQVFRLMISYI